ncbi:MAG TPA: cyclic nucleotide-binding domain-containing protein [Chitinophagaceae bacterium]|nr:cyclic nucleotide-binding domain-containing protein [Chitinophagaceae bacterium]
MIYIYRMFEAVIASIKTYGNFSTKDLDEITGRLKVLALKKNNVVIKEGDTCRQFYFINHGSLRQYMIQDDGTEAILNLYVDHDWAFDYKSFMTQQPAAAILLAAEDTELFELNALDFHELVKISDGFFRLGKIFEQAIINLDYQNNRITPEEKYQLLLKKKPAILQKFALKWIASYLGMAPETLSRIRRRSIS